jgi:arylsulfatase A-like enzyme
MASSRVGRPPDILIVTLDCVRAWDFPGTSSFSEPMPFLDSLRKESVVFPHACAPAPWTVPAIATLFTGLYPWEHGAHAKRSLHLSSGIPRLPDLLRTAGYRSICLSSNPLMSPPTGLCTGFDYAGWASEFERYLRTQRSSEPPHSTEVRTPRPPSFGGRIRQMAFGRLPHEELPIVSLLGRNIAALAVAHRVIARLQTGNGVDDDFSVGRWIEPTLESWLDSQPGDAPVFGFVNLCDAHEPYFPDAEALRSVGWRRFSRVRQDRFTWLPVRHRVPPEHNELLRQLYRRAIARMDRRIRRMVEILQASGRWENTLLIITGDHGQAFGEHGALFHRFRIEEPVIRIPIWARFPRGEMGGATARGWASLVDFVPTCLTRAGIYSSRPLSGLPLERLVEEERAEPAFAMTDGTIGEPWIPLASKAEFDRVWVAAYKNNRKLVFNAEEKSFRAYDVDRDPYERNDLWPAEESSFSYLGEELKDIAGRVTAQPVAPIEEDVQDRLRSWGYL